VPPIDDPESRPLDWGGDATVLPWLSYYHDVGALLGGGVQFKQYGFRQYPYAHSHTLRAGYGTAAGRWRAEYLGDFRRSGALAPRGEVIATASGLEVLRFYGFGNGNGSPAPGSDQRYFVNQQQYLLSPTYVRQVAGGNLSLGPLVRFSNTQLEPGQLIAQVRPYGIGRFGQVGAGLGWSLDRRDRPDAARKGVLLSTSGTFYPAVWSVASAYGQVRGAVATYVPLPFDASLGVRAGGQRVFGRYPFQDAAFVGSWDTVRGLPQNRYAGDGALFGNVELRVPLNVDLISSGRIGVFALGDVGRVYLEGESSSRWHRSWGGGAWLALANGRRTFSAACARSEGTTGLYVHAGLLF
jgi:hypothetical protein